MTTPVKEEPDEEVDINPGDACEVPPGVVLDKLEELLKGRILLRYDNPPGWGLNGKLEGAWCTFIKGEDGSCQFVDGDQTVWVTGDAETWAESELETLERNYQEALKLPGTDAEQPSSLQPRTCRRAVFMHHRAEYAKRRGLKVDPKAKVKAGAPVAKPGVAKPGGVVPVRPTIGKVAPAPAKPGAPVAKPGVAKAGAAQIAKVAAPRPGVAPQVAKVAPQVAKTPAARPGFTSPVAKTPVPKVAPAPQVAKVPAQVAKVPAPRPTVSTPVVKTASPQIAKTPMPQVAKVPAPRPTVAKTPGAQPAIAKVAVAKTPVAQPAIAKVAVAKTPAQPAVPKTAVAKVSPAVPKPAVAKTPLAVEAAKPASEPVKVNAQFLITVKNRLLTELKDKEKYKKFLGAANRGVELDIIKALDGHADLIAQFRQNGKIGATTGAKENLPPSGQPIATKPTIAAQPPQPTKPVATKASASPWLRGEKAAIDVETEVLTPSRQCSSEVATNLTKLALGKRQIRANFRLAMLRYIKNKMAEESSYREVIILRGPPGMGKSNWALEQLKMQLGITEDDEWVARMTHICSADDFSIKINAATGEEEYSLNAEASELNHARNQARVQLAMDAGIHPLYVDNSHMQLWEMGEYARMAQQAGYEVSIVSPEDIYPQWGDIDALVERNKARPADRVVSREHLEDWLTYFEPIPDGEDAVQASVASERPAPKIVATNGLKRPLAPTGNPPAKVAKVAGAPLPVAKKPGAPPPGKGGWGALRPAVSKVAARRP